MPYIHCIHYLCCLHCPFLNHLIIFLGTYAVYIWICDISTSMYYLIPTDSWLQRKNVGRSRFKLDREGIRHKSQVPVPKLITFPWSLGAVSVRMDSHIRGYPFWETWHRFMSFLALAVAVSYGWPFNFLTWPSGFHPETDDLLLTTKFVGHPECWFPIETLISQSAG